jgi:hypothetical protein
MKHIQNKHRQILISQWILKNLKEKVREPKVSRLLPILVISNKKNP